MWRALSGLLCVFLFMVTSASAGPLRTGSFTFDDWQGPPLTVYYAEPDLDALADAPVVFVMHGVRRNADEYAANWHELAKEYGLRIYAPEFSRKDFPGSARYNLGGRPGEGPFAFAALEPLYASIRARGGTPDGYYLFGHSAGAQYVHRALLFEDMPGLRLAMAANAGWYTLPDLTIAWPYGLQGSGAEEADLRRWLGQPMVVMLGDADNDPGHENLRRTREANAQGPHRFARGQYFMDHAGRAADERELTLRWTRVTVPGIAHDNAGMALAAAALIADHARPDTGATP